jgi:hypothetical protein
VCIFQRSKVNFFLEKTGEFGSFVRTESRAYLRHCLGGVVMSGEDAPRPCLENLIVLEIKTNKQTEHKFGHSDRRDGLTASHTTRLSACGTRRTQMVTAVCPARLANDRHLHQSDDHE